MTTSKTKKVGYLLPNGIPLAADVISNVEPKSDEEVKNNRGAKGGKGEVNKIHSYPTGCNTHFGSQVATYSESGTLQCVFQLFHNGKITKK